jgi:DNA repair protein RecO (recombination protein O)
MNDAVEFSGMVLSAMPVGENDKRLVLMTREAGKITAFARGARRPKSTLLAASNPFVTGHFRLIPGRDAYSLVGADVKDYFTDLAADIPGIYYGFYFLEMTGYYGREGLDGTEMLNLAYLSLKALQNERLDDRLVRRVFELRLMAINGDYSAETADDKIRYTCRFIVSAPLEKLYTFTVAPEILDDLAKHIDRCLARVIDRRIKSREILAKFVGE